jgi:hypothetical protein
MQAPIAAKSIEATLTQTIYPEPYASKVKGRLKRKLGSLRLDKLWRQPDPSFPWGNVRPSP